MKKMIFALLVLAVVAFAAFDQTYMQQVSRNGDATIEKTTDISIFAGQLSNHGFENIDKYCKNTTDVVCSMDVGSKTITMSDEFSSGIYYTLTTEYGLPYTTYTLEISRIPTDRFSTIFENILVAIGEANASGNIPAAIDFENKEYNKQVAESLKNINVNLDYIIEMPADIESASAGAVQATVEGNTATFDLVEVMEESETMVVVSKELNYGYLIAIIGAIVLIIMAYIFVRSSRPKKGIKKRK